MVPFYELIQVALNESANGVRTFTQCTLTESDWEQLHNICQKQSVLGLAFIAIERLGNEGMKLPLNILYRWLAEAENIKQKNLRVNKRCVELTQMFAEAEMQSCILKGQGNALLYSNPLSRTPGDIDIWIRAERDVICNYVQNKFPGEKAGKLHIDFPIFKDVPVEVHFMPRFLYTPWHNKALQTFFAEGAERQFKHEVSLDGDNGSVAVPTLEFNIIYQMTHMMGHLMGAGIGLRQFIDYYYLLKSYTGDRDFRHLFNQMGLLKFARGVMWIEKELLGLEESFFVVEPLEKMGRQIQRIMEEGGNFGQYSKINTFRRSSLFGRVVGGIRQSLRNVRFFPSEAIWKIIKKVY